MTQAGDVLELDPMGVRVEIERTAAQTDGELLEFVVVGSPRGLLAQPHVHEGQAERLEVLSGELDLQVDGRTLRPGPGESVEVPAGARHRQRVGSGRGGRVRVQIRPPGRTQEFLERLAEMCASGEMLPGGWPRPLAAAALVRDFADVGHAAWPPLAVQTALARWWLRAGSREYVFVDEWDVAAPADATFAALADGRTYPEWWRPVYIGVEAEGAPAVGQVSLQHFKGRLPYRLRTRSRITRLEPPRILSAEVEGDLRGRGTWTLTPIPGGTHVRFDWRVHADRRLLRVLTPLLRPAFRWNHNWAIARAIEGLEPYARRTSAAEGQEARISAQTA
jgi:mannose-6-phosphate isomerase-like protein (cupin superfamily)/uncharacterized protein YndB with AHSA1/START domain